MEADRYADTYRSAEAQQVMCWIRAGQSGCVVGLRGAGKSNFLRFLFRPDTKRQYLKQDSANHLFALINLFSLTERTEWAVYELILSRLLGQLCRQEPGGEITNEVTSLHQQAISARDPFAAQRALETSLSLLCRRDKRHVTLFLDEFDAVFRDLDPALFRCLRALRDEHKGRVAYIVAVFEELEHLRENSGEVDHFQRLVTGNLCGLGPYVEDDARQMIRYLASQRGRAVIEDDVVRLLVLSGGHAGILKASLGALWAARDMGGSKGFGLDLGDAPRVRAECQKVWDSLLESDQVALCALARGARLDQDARRHLGRRGLVRELRSGCSIVSSLLADFVRQQVPPSPEGTVIRRSPRLVQIAGRGVEGLTEMEFEMLHYLYKQQGRVCTKGALADNVYGCADGVSDETLYALISRLRAKIEPDPGQPRYIVNIRGQGYKFVEP